MKKRVKLGAIVATLLIVAAAVITFEACNKKNEMVKNIPELNVAGLSDMDMEMIMFGEKMRSARKGGESMPIDEAIGILTDYQNFKMSDVRNYSDDMECLTIEETIPVNNGDVYLSDLYVLYESNRNQIKERLSSLEGDEKTVYCIYSKIDDNSKDDDEAQIVTKAYMYGRSIPPITCFDESLYWWTYIECDTCLGGNAFDVLESRLNLSLDHYGCPPGYRLIPYDLHGELVFSHEYIDPNSPNGQYGLINYEYDDNILGADEMYYYYMSALNKLNEWKVAQNQYDRVLLLVTYWNFYDSALDADFYKIRCTVDLGD